MNGQQDRMEAAAWLARLHGQDRGPELEAGFRRWLNESESHRTAFEMANEVWGDLAAIPKSEHPIQVRFRNPPRASIVHRPALAIAASVAAVAALSILWWQQTPTVTTEVGQLRELTLEDGTRVTLNTDTRIEIRYDRDRRHIELSQGEAWFDVAKDAARPFSVAASGRQVLALGTSFVVRRDPDHLAVTLIDGKVAVSARPASVPIVLAPGERVTFTGGEQPSLDTPRLEKVTAWKHRQVSLDHNTLADAVAEMNRYSTTRMRVEGAAAGEIVVTGIFRAGDSKEFARAVADTYKLTLRDEGDRLVLSSPH